jgi:hypothetical protein
VREHIDQSETKTLGASRVGGRGYADPYEILRMHWVFEIGARVFEYTKPEPGGADHCVRTDDLTFTIESEGLVADVAVSGLAA